MLLDVNEYTDFGKGFYTHPEESKQKAVEWAKRRNREWGVVRFTLTQDELSKITTQRLLFTDKFISRPPNAPKLFDSNPATWIEFVEFNRHIRTTTIQRPKDNDWTADYGWIRGPIWGRADSNLPGPPGLPERYHDSANLEFLAQLFEDGTISDTGTGNELQTRLLTILEASSDGSNGGVTHFAKIYSGCQDRGFRAAFKDPWPSSRNQVGHFTTRLLS